LSRSFLGVLVLAEKLIGPSPTISPPPVVTVTVTHTITVTIPPTPQCTPPPTDPPTSC
jgi:hypothetical protein